MIKDYCAERRRANTAEYPSTVPEGEIPGAHDQRHPGRERVLWFVEIYFGVHPDAPGCCCYGSEQNEGQPTYNRLWNGMNRSPDFRRQSETHRENSSY